MGVEPESSWVTGADFSGGGIGASAIGVAGLRGFGRHEPVRRVVGVPPAVHQLGPPGRAGVVRVVDHLRELPAPVVVPGHVAALGRPGQGQQRGDIDVR